MKAPDKIYIPLYPNYSLDGFHLADEWMYEPHKEVENVEYIRKDALLEWLQEVRAIPHENAIARDLAFQEVINKLNSI